MSLDEWVLVVANNAECGLTYQVLDESRSLKPRSSRGLKAKVKRALKRGRALTAAKNAIVYGCKLYGIRRSVLGLV